MGQPGFAGPMASFRAEHPRIQTLLPMGRRFTSEFQNMDGLRTKFCKSVEPGTEQISVFVTRNDLPAAGPSYKSVRPRHCIVVTLFLGRCHREGHLLPPCADEVS
jgi:hypothetical protein